MILFDNNSIEVLLLSVVAFNLFNMNFYQSNNKWHAISKCLHMNYTNVCKQSQGLHRSPLRT